MTRNTYSYPYPAFREEEWIVSVAGDTRRFLLRTPTRLADDPALLVNLAGDRYRSLHEYPYRQSSDLFLAAGHRVLSFDLPNHGEQIDAHGDGLAGMAAAVADGVDVFGELVATGKAIIDACLQRSLVRSGRIAIAGTSRGGLCALHLLAADARIAALAAFGPVTCLLALSEFAALADSPIVQRSNALCLVPRVASRPIFLAIVTADPRVGTEHCLRFYDALQAAAPANVRRQHILDLTDGDSHATPIDDGYLRGGIWLLQQL